MRWKKGEVYILTFLLFIVAAVFGTREPWDRPAFSFEAVTEAGTETIQIWNRGDGEGFVFLPSYVRLDQLKIHTSRPVWMGEHKLTYGQTLENLELDGTYALSGRTKDLKKLTFLRSGHLPALFIDTASSSMEAIHEDKTHREGGELRLYTSEGTLACSSGLTYIKGRGRPILQETKVELRRNDDFSG